MSKKIASLTIYHKLLLYGIAAFLIISAVQFGVSELALTGRQVENDAGASEGYLELGASCWTSIPEECKSGTCDRWDGYGGRCCYSGKECCERDSDCSEGYCFDKLDSVRTSYGSPEYCKVEAKQEGEWCGSSDAMCASGLECNYRCTVPGKSYCETTAYCCNKYFKCEGWVCGDWVAGSGSHTDEYGYTMGTMGYCIQQQEAPAEDLIANGGYCQYSSDCQSGWCYDNTCCLDGKGCCSSDLDCATGYECSNYYCVASAEEPADEFTYETTKLADGKACSSSSECRSTWCANFVCCNSGELCCLSNSDCVSGYQCGVNYYCIESTATETITQPIQEEVTSTPSISPRTEFVTQTIRQRSRVETKLSVGPIDDNEITLRREERYVLSSIIENLGTEDVSLSSYKISSGNQNTVSVYDASGGKGSTKTTSLSGPLKPGTSREVTKVVDELYGSSSGTSTLTFDVNYYAKGISNTETVTVYVTVLDEHVEKDEEGSDAFGRECLKEQTQSGSFTLTSDEGGMETATELVFVRPNEEEWATSASQWQKANSDFKYYANELVGDLTPVPDAVDFAGTVSDLAETKTPEETTAVTARALAPGTVMIGYDLAGTATNLKRMKATEKMLKKEFRNSKLANVMINGELWKVLYRQKDGKIYAIKLGKVIGE